MLKELVEMANVQQLRRSPLAARTQELQQASGTAAALREIPFTTQVGLRATPGTDGHAALAEALGGLPAKVGDVVGDSNATEIGRASCRGGGGSEVLYGGRQVQTKS